MINRVRETTSLMLTVSYSVQAKFELLHEYLDTFQPPYHINDLTYLPFLQGKT